MEPDEDTTVVQTDEDAQRLIKVAGEAHKWLVMWIEWLAADHLLELGDNPEILRRIESDLASLAVRMRSLNDLFDLAYVPLKAAMPYFNATQRLDDAIQLVRSIREAAHGSPQNTQLCLVQIRRCAESVRHVGAVALAPVAL